MVLPRPHRSAISIRVDAHARYRERRLELIGKQIIVAVRQRLQAHRPGVQRRRAPNSVTTGAAGATGQDDARGSAANDRRHEKRSVAAHRERRAAEMRRRLAVGKDRLSPLENPRFAASGDAVPGPPPSRAERPSTVKQGRCQVVESASTIDRIAEDWPRELGTAAGLQPHRRCREGRRAPEIRRARGRNCHAVCERPRVPQVICATRPALASRR